MLVARAPRPDAPLWPGRQLLSVVDAVAWPAAGLAAMSLVPKAGVVGLIVDCLLVLMTVRRTSTALFRNERYRFTTFRWGIPVITLVALGIAMKAVAV